MVSDLHCPGCERTYPAGPDEPWRCECGHALEFADTPCPSGSPVPLARIDTSTGLWTFHEFMPVSRQVSYGEGMTPLVEVPEWGATFKLEYLFPTGSFKDRGATTTISRALELGVETVIEDSSGNAGAAIATYAARAGLEAEIYIPADVRQSKLMAIQRAGARPVRIDGDRAAATEACIEAVESGDGWYASHAWNPAFYAGTMTFALEAVAQQEWTVPDVVVLPIGHGTLFLGAYRGFLLLERAGIIDELPRLYGVQAKGCAPIVDTLGGEIVDEDERNDVSDFIDGIQIDRPARAREIVAAIEDTGGDVIALGGDPVEAALDRLHRSGFYVEPTGAVAAAGLEHFRERGDIDTDDDILVPLTGTAMKTI